MNNLDISHSKSTYWHRGGPWEIIWLDWDDGYPEPDHWLRSEYPDGCWIYSAKIGAVLEKYSPLDDEPYLYLHFARLGESVWKIFNGQYTSSFQRDSYIPDELKSKTVEFLQRFGTLYFDYNKYFLGPPLEWRRDLVGLGSEEDFREEFLDQLLNDAQRVALAVRYLQVATYQKDESALTDWAKAVKALLKVAEDERRMANPLWLFERFRERDKTDLSTHRGVVDYVEYLVNTWTKRGISELRLIPERVQFDDMPYSDWKTTLAFHRLQEVIWYQVHRAIIQKATIRVCKNERCPLDGGLFEPDRIDQRYCTKKCRDAHNAWQYRQRKLRGRNKKSEDVLP